MMALMRTVLLGSLSIFIGVVVACQQDGLTESSSKKTNIIVIMTDDMGFSDPGFMGSGIETPGIDRLAAKGMVFNQFYNTGRCCPSRASLMTGLYAHRTGLGWMTASDQGLPGYRGEISDSTVTIAQVLQEKGYATYMTGKWHLVYDRDMGADGPKDNWPIQRGFDRYFGILAGGGGYFSPVITYNNTQPKVPDDFYLTSAINDSTVAFLEDHFTNQPDQPFFFYVAHYAPHRPLHALDEDIDKYRGKFMQGWDYWRKQRYEHMLQAGIIDSTWQLSARGEGIPAWDELSEDEKQVWDGRMAVYAAMVDRMDQGISALINTLEKYDQLDDTLILFLSDNGGCAEAQGGQLAVSDLPELGKIDQSYRMEWANVSNTPLRWYKQHNHAGGINTPLIVHWPEKIKSGRITDQPGHIIDLMPTLLDVAGAEYPGQFNGKTIYPMQGESQLSALSGKSVNRSPIFFEHQGNRAVIANGWKLVALEQQKPPYSQPWELYHLDADHSEINNLINDFPQKAAELEALWNDWAQENNVLPLNGKPWKERLSEDIHR